MHKRGLLYRALTRFVAPTTWKRWLVPSRLYLLSRRLGPLSPFYGFDRGSPIDRHYIERFLLQNRESIRGACLEVKSDAYTHRYGGERVTRRDVLDIDRSNSAATIHGDLRRLPEISDDRYDCIILTQVLQYVDDYPAAVRECRRILKPGGVLLASVPSLTRIDPRSGIDRDFWRFTRAGAKHLFDQAFAPGDVAVRAHGNCFAGLAFWIGMSVEELGERELGFDDPSFPVVVTIRAVKP